MFTTLVWATIAVCAGGMVYAYFSTRDVFHPAILLASLYVFVYGYMPLSLLKSGTLFAYVTVEQAQFCQTLALIGIVSLMAGCFGGANHSSPARLPKFYSWETLQSGGIRLGVVGMGCWLFTIHGAGGFTGAFGKADGAGWSEIGYVRDAVYLLVVALILLITPECLKHRDKKWTLIVVLFTIPWLVQGLLGARRGPTFVIAGTIAMSWYLSQRRRPSVPLMATGAFALGSLMLFLVTNRDKIYLGSDFSNVRTNITNVVTDANESNEYIFGIGCIEAAKQKNHYFWGRRYIAQVLIRPIPHQLWPNKYEDFGVPELLKNAGVAGTGLAQIMGWRQVPGAAAALVADFWVEFSWLMFPVMYAVGYLYGYFWKRAIDEGGPWNSQYTIISVLAVYLVTQSGEAIIFRLVLLTIPTRMIWQKAAQAFCPAPIEEEVLCEY